MKRFSICLALFALVALPMAGATKWGPSGCEIAAQSPVGGAGFHEYARGQMSHSGNPTLAWRMVPGTPDEAYLFRDGLQIGGWQAQTQCYRPLLDFQRNEWGPPEPFAPIPPPAHLVRSAPDSPVQKNPPLEFWQLEGVRPGKISDCRESVSGVTLTQAEPGGEGKIIDDSHKLRLSIFARDPARRAAVVEDLKRDPKLWQWVQDRCHLWAGDAARPDYFLNKDHRKGVPLYALDGEPTIMLQTPDGVELWHDAGYTQGARSLENLRKRDPNYRPDDTPGPRNPARKDEEAALPLLLIGAACVGGLLFFPAAKGRNP